MAIYYFFVIMFGLFFDAIVNGQSGEFCLTPNEENATCVLLQDCVVLYNQIKEIQMLTDSSQFIYFLRESQCGGNSNLPLVCCGTVAGFENIPGGLTDERGSNLISLQINPLIPNRDDCGFQSIDKIIGGEETDLVEFPWMALLQYRTPSGGCVLSCGGSLINNRYVLTAAHCVSANATKKAGRLTSVRLGEWDTSTDIDCLPLGSDYCNQEPIEIGVEKTIIHPNYATGINENYNDIALIRLKKVVEFNDFIKPICLPIPSERSLPGTYVWIAGWGRTEIASYSTIKKKLRVPIVSNKSCNVTFSTANVTINKSQICAGGELNRDSCSGDSGGPLMQTATNDTAQWYIEGIVSFGVRCGTRNWPGIYTRVTEYLSWIHENVKE